MRYSFKGGRTFKDGALRDVRATALGSKQPLDDCAQQSFQPYRLNV